ncbi:MAG TPA: hypothetical protein VEG08_00940 [Terriglobales bacterium]|nr:hypothetical protein [Terriglobales bacterium]
MTPDAVAAMTAEQRRQRKQMRVLVAVAGAALAVAVGVMLKEAWPAKQHAAAPAAAAPAAPAQSQAAPASTVQTSSDQAASPAGGASQQEPPAQAPGNPAAAAPASPGGIDLGEVQKALAQMTQRTAGGTGTPAAAAPSGSDRYPGSQPVNVDDTQLPDIGIPVAREVYSTTDSVATVIRYYQQRYPDARLMEINGQQVLAVDRPGLSKVIAIGSTGQETRIAIVQPGG